ncbi:F-box domain-containing protein [Apiospora sp. TS-2023a]
MTSRSQRDVLGTTELLQNILLHLDLQTLLVSSQLVDRRWRDLIRDSAALQQALFFRGVPEPPSPREDEDMFMDGGQESGDVRDDNGESSKTGPLRMNPLLREKFDRFFYDAERDAKATPGMKASARRYRRRLQECMLQSKHFPDLPLAATEEAREAFMRPEASWRRMLVTQPPARRIGFSEERHGMGGVGYRFSELRLDGDGDDGEAAGGGGLRMGQLYDAGASWVIAHANFGILWNPAHFRWPTSAANDTRTRQVNRDEKAALAGRVDVLFSLRHSSGCMGPSKAEREQIARERGEFKASFYYPGTRGKPSLQATKSIKWKKHSMDGTVAEAEFGWVE